MSHTPGPWKAHTPPTGRPFITCEAPGHGTTGILADVSFNDNQQANARLIAAAPDLLAALERLTHPMADDDDLQFALETIAKAKGQA